MPTTTLFSPPIGPAMSAARHLFLSTRALTPDRFQIEAFDALDAGRSVLVAAPTGSGKTLVADYAVDRAITAGRVAVYTTPIKALSNQKLRDLCAQHATANVGLITGDRTIRPHAPVVVMTTEVLRSLLSDRAPLLDELGVVVLDEIHYLGDPERGPVWEEVVMTVASDVQLVGLSATVPDAASVADWMRGAHGPTDLVIETVRPVELRHLYALTSSDVAAPVLLPILINGQANPAIESRLDRRRRGGVLRSRDATPLVTPARDDLLGVLSDGMLPAIWFILSRAGCDRAVAEIVESGLRLTDRVEALAIRNLAEHACMPLGRDERRAVKHEAWLHALEAGFAAHHGGQLPVHREVVEAALSAGLVKVVFATETLAVGVNLPARTVVVDRLTRGAGADAEMLRSSTVAQLVGRAGRRGLDPVGNAIIPWSKHVRFSHVVALTGGSRDALHSSFVPTPVLVLGMLERGGIADVRQSVRQSYAEHQRRAAMVPLEEERRLRAAELVEVEALLSAAAPVLRAPAVAAVGDVDPIGVALAAMAVGDVFVDPGRARDGRRAVVAVPRMRRGQVALDVVGGDARRSVVTRRELRQPPVIVGRLDLAHIDLGRGAARSIAASLAELRSERPDVVERAAERLADDEAHARDVAAAERRAARLRAELVRLDHELVALADEADHQLDGTLALLRRRGHLNGDQSTASGRALRRLYHRSGSLVVELLRNGVLDGLDVASLVAVVSFCTAAPGAEAAQGLATAELAERWRTVVELAEGLHRDEDECTGVRTPDPSMAAATALWRWATTGSLSATLDGYADGPGDLVREARQVVELLGQIERVASPALLDACRAARATLLTGVVIAGIDDEPWDD